jgi:hypothetical protein|tara:strand:+ start:14318 stop:14530 length:213 start_codon:yes stop_codon:yes gene_type:complete
MTVQYNACSLGPQSAEEAKALNFSRMDCLAKHNIERLDKKAAMAWFTKQPEDWKESRAARFTSRINQRRW